ncbi:MAG: alkaline phosphatase family protein [bacterium]
MKIIVIGLDGACFELIDPWIEQGELPNLRKIRDEGTWGDMNSCLPPTTSPNWKCYSTGKNPGKLGICWWENIDFKGKKIYFPRNRIHKNKEMWDYLGEAGKRVCVVNMPLTYPPRPVNGILICGSADAGDHGFTYPADLERYLEENYDYRVHPPILGPLSASPDDVERTEQQVSQIIKIIESRFRVAKDFWEQRDVDFLHVTTFYINQLQHSFWNAEYTKKAWQVIDQNIGELVGREHNIIIMSDHGCNEVKEAFNINTWLQTEGYLKLNRTISDLLYRIGLNRQRAVKIARALHLENVLPRVIPRQISGFLPDRNGAVGGSALMAGSAKTQKVNWDKTVSLASGQGPIYIAPNLRQQLEEYKSLRDELIEKLQGLKSGLSGEAPISKVFRKEDIYQGEYLPEMPDLVADQAKGFTICGDIGRKEAFELPRGWRGENKKAGLFMAYGPDIKNGQTIEAISILDLAPTILHMMGLPIPQDMDGKVLTEIFKPDSEPAKRKVTYQQIDKTEMEKMRVRRKTRHLKV